MSPPGAKVDPIGRGSSGVASHRPRDVAPPPSRRYVLERMLAATGIVILLVALALVLMPRVRLSRDVVSSEQSKPPLLDPSTFGESDAFLAGGASRMRAQPPSDEWTDSSHTAHYDPRVRSVGPAPTMERLNAHTWRATQPTPIQIGRPASPLSEAVLATLRSAVASTGATTICWFWVSINGDPPHLGLGVAPALDAVVSRVGQAVEPVWKHHSPDNPLIDILRLGDPDLDATIREQGHLLLGAWNLHALH